MFIEQEKEKFINILPYVNQFTTLSELNDGI